MEDQEYYFETIKLCYNLLHKDYCTTLSAVTPHDTYKDYTLTISIDEQFHDKYIEHICHRLEKIIKEHNDKITYVSIDK